MKIRNSLLTSLLLVVFSNICIAQFQFDSVIAYYPFRYDCEDESGNGYHGIEMGAVLTDDMFGNPQNAYNFDGISSRIQLNQDSAIITVMEFTLSVWAKMDGPGGGNGNNMIFEQRCNSADQTAGSTIALSAEDDNGNIEFSLRGYYPPSPYPIQVHYPAFPYGEWHHYVITCDTADDMMRMFLDMDMVLIEPFVQVGNFHTNIDWVSIGAHHYWSGIKGAFNGDIDDLMIFAGALDSIQIADLYNWQINSIMEKEKRNQYSLYPNPAKDFFHIKDAGVKKLEIYTVSGDLVSCNENISSNINISMLNPGLYFVLLYNQSGTLIEKKKLLKQ